MSQLEGLIDAADDIVIIQADNPDGDSLASSLALEAMLLDMGKNPLMYCGVDIPGYLRYMEGWDRVLQKLPAKFDLSIIVDTSSLLLLESLEKSGEIKWLKTRPCIVIDHHISEPTIDFAKVEHIKPAVSTGELIYKLADENNWPMSLDFCEFIASSIMSDSLGLISESTTSESALIISRLMAKGVSLAKLDSKRREHHKKQRTILAYKGKLLQRVEYSGSGSTAYITIPWEEIEKYSPLYNPPMLVLDEMRQVEDVKVAVAFKSYPDGRITAKLRSNFGSPVCAEVAEKFGGGGHEYASGFRITDGSQLQTVVDKCLNIIDEQIEELKA